MKEIFINIYKFIFLRKKFYEFNLHLFKIALRGIGALNSGGIKESGEKYFFEKIAKSHKLDTIFEVGANEGGYTQILRKIFPESEIYSFEPNPNVYIKLRSNTKNLNIHTYNYGFSNKNERSKLWDVSQKPLNKNYSSPLSTLYKDVITDLYKQRPISNVVKLKTIDSFCKSSDIDKIDLLCLDTEGNEFNILKGAVKMLKKNKIGIVLFEFNEMNVVSRVFLKDFMIILPNFVFFRLFPDGLIKLDNYSPKTHEIFAYQNIAAFNKSVFNTINL